MSFAGTVPEILDCHLGKPIFDPFAKRITQGLPECNLALELACGVGVCSRRLSRVMPSGAMVVAVDTDEANLSLAARKLFSLGPIGWTRASADQLPFDEACAGAVICNFGMATFEDKPAVLQEIHRVLIPGGLFRYTVWSTMDQNPWIEVVRSVTAKMLPGVDPNWYDAPFQFADVNLNLSLMENAGFREVRLTPLRLLLRETDPLALSRGFIQGNAAIRSSLVERSVSVAEAEAKLAAALVANFGSPIRALMRAFVFEAGALD